MHNTCKMYHQCLQNLLFSRAFWCFREVFLKLHVSSYNNSDLLMNQTHLLKIYCRVDIFCSSKQSMNYTEPNINVNLFTIKKNT